MEIGKLKDLFERHPRPANTDKIVVPKVNSEIWATLSARAKQRDAKALQVQRTIVHSTFCVLEAVNDILELENEHIKEKVVKNLTDAVHMLGLTNYDLNLKRSHAMKFELSPDPMVASASCAPEVKVTQFLFGKDVAIPIIWKTKKRARGGLPLPPMAERGSPSILSQKAEPRPSGKAKIPELLEKGSQVVGMYHLTYHGLDFYDFVINFNRQSKHLVDNFKAGRICKFISKWQ